MTILRRGVPSSIDGGLRFLAEISDRRVFARNDRRSERGGATNRYNASFSIGSKIPDSCCMHCLKYIASSIIFGGEM